MTQFSIRRFNPTVVRSLVNQGFEEPLARALASRGITCVQDTDLQLNALLAPTELKNCGAAAVMLADAIVSGEAITIVGDYDCDGATATSVALLGLKRLGAKNVNYIIPDREKDGYGISSALVEKAHASGCRLIITVDNGISAHAAIERARALGIRTLITDHHLAADTLPDADCIVNPNQPGDSFPSKFLAGVGVMFYVLLATRAEMRKRGIFDVKTQPNLLALIDLVALGTVADVVPLDKNNRILVSKGLERIRSGYMHPGVAALLNISKRNACSLTATDLGFALAPRINAAGRLSDIRCGIECLTSTNPAAALRFADELNTLNDQRKEKERSGLEEALAQMGTVELDDSRSICLYKNNWHSGIVGLIASRIREKSYRPTICFASNQEYGDNGELKGSGRSIQGVHLRDALDIVDKTNPGLIERFGGHAQAAGLTIKKENFEKFKEAFETVIQKVAPADAFNRTLMTDGELFASDFTLQLAQSIQQHVWGSGFPEPIFMNQFRVIKQDLLKGEHLRLKLETDGIELNGIWFRHKDPLPEKVTLAYRLSVNEWAGRRTIQLMIEAAEDTAEDFAS